MLQALFIIAGTMVASVSFAFAQFSSFTNLIPGFGSGSSNITVPAAPTSTASTTPVVAPTATGTPSTTPAVPVAKVTTTLDYSKPYTSVHSGPAVVKKEAFGTVYTTFNTLPNYKKAVEQVPNQSIRWPGGSFAERTGPDRLYDLTFPDIYKEPAPGEAGYSANNQKGLTDVMAYAVEKNLPFVMVIPTEPYFNNVANGQAHLREFMIKLVRGDYGPLPTSITLEIGNENAHVGWVNGKFTPGPGSYGFVTNAFLTTINSVLNDVKLNPQKKRVDVAIWIGSTEGGMPNIYKQISAANMKTVDGFVHHIGLVANINEYDFATTNRKFGVAKSYWNAAFGGRNVPEMRLIATEWNVGNCDKPTSPAGYLRYDVGARQAPTVVNNFSQMIGGGLDVGMLWGNQTCISQMLWHSGETISHGGHAFRLMAESLTGTQLLAGKVNSRGFWTRTGTNYDVIGYRDNTKMVVFISAGDIPASGLDVTVSLTNFGTIKSITTESVKTTLSQPGDPSPDDDRIYEEAVISKGTLTPTGNSFTYRLTEDYELARVIINR
ncbi:MAG: hypothetical protein MUF19_00700 [Candidatus Pacebacteria bacterium]|jgi:hypothetical protein|nr:hypothetical protein [Candidatus Paceibacterota bacterium]